MDKVTTYREYIIKIANIKTEEYDPSHKLRNLKTLKHMAIGGGLGVVPGTLMAQNIYKKVKPSDAIKSFEPELAKSYERLARRLAASQFLGGIGLGAGIGIGTVAIPGLVKGIKQYNELKNKGKKSEINKTAKLNIVKKITKPFKSYADIMKGRNIDKYQALQMKVLESSQKPIDEANYLLDQARRVKPNFLDNNAWGEALNPVRRSYQALAESRINRSKQLIGRAEKFNNQLYKEMGKQTVATIGTGLGIMTTPFMALGVISQTPWFKRYEKKGIEDLINNNREEYLVDKDYYDKRLLELNSQLEKKAFFLKKREKNDKNSLYELAKEKGINPYIENGLLIGAGTGIPIAIYDILKNRDNLKHAKKLEKLKRVSKKTGKYVVIGAGLGAAYGIGKNLLKKDDIKKEAAMFNKTVKYGYKFNKLRKSVGDASKNIDSLNNINESHEGVKDKANKKI